MSLTNGHIPTLYINALSNSPLTWYQSLYLEKGIGRGGEQCGLTLEGGVGNNIASVSKWRNSFTLDRNVET